MEFYDGGVVVMEECRIDLVNDDFKKGFGGTCKASRPPSSISTALFIDGLSDGLVCMQHKLTIIIFLTITSSSSVTRP